MRRIHNPSRSIFASVLLWLLVLGSPHVMAVGTYYVSPTGSDANTGGYVDPFLTIPRAQTALRAAGGGTVYLRGGTYTLTSTVAFNEQDSNSTYQAYGAEVPIISGGVVLSNWTPYTGDIYQTHVTWNFRGLFKDGVRLNYKNPITYIRTTNGWTINVRFTDSAGPTSLVSAGDWALDSTTGTVYYKTGGGAPTGTIVAGSLGLLFSVAATTETARVTNLTFDHLYFFYNNWLIPGDDTTYTDNWIGTFALGTGYGQIPGAVLVQYATNVTFRSCRIAHNESDGIAFGPGVSNSQVVGSEVWDNAGNGIHFGFTGNMGPSGWIAGVSDKFTDNYAHDNGVLFPTTINIFANGLSDPQESYNRTDNTEFDSIEAQGYTGTYHADYNHIAHANISPWVADGGGIYSLSEVVSPAIGYPATYTGNLVHSTNGFGPMYVDTSNDQYTVSSNVTYNVGFNPSPPLGISYIVFNNNNNLTAASCCNNATPTPANINAAVASTGPRSPYAADLFGGNGGDTTVTFMDRPGNAPLAGLYNNINWGFINQQYPAGWGAQVWYTGINGAHYAFINSSSTAAVAQTITLPPGTMLKSFQATATGTASITVYSNGNPTLTFTPTASWSTFTTGWTGSPTFTTGYTAGAEDVTIQVTGSNGASSVHLTNIVFGSPSTSTSTRVDDGGTGASYTGTGWTTTPDSNCYLGTQHFTNTANDYAQFTFTGTSVDFGYTTSSNRGKADIYIDGVFQQTVDFYSAATVYQVILYSKTGLSSGSHTLKILNNGTKNASSTDYYIGVDFFDYGTSTSTRVDDSGTGPSYTGTGWTTLTDSNCYLSTQHFSNIANDYAQLTFTGTSVDFGYTTSSNRGKADIYIDSVFQQTVDFYSAATVYQVILYSKTGLSSGSHTLKIVNNGTKNTGSSDYYVGVDFFDYQ